MVSQLCLKCGSTKNCQTLCLGAHSRYSLVVDEDVKKPNKQTKTNLNTVVNTCIEMIEVPVLHCGMEM